MTYLIFHLVGYDRKDDLDNLFGKVVIRLIDTTYESALERARGMIEKPFWLLAETCEYFKKEGE